MIAPKQDFNTQDRLLLPPITEGTKRLRKKLYKQKRRARDNGLTPTLTINEFLIIMYSNGGRCTFCGDADANTIEHLLPLSMGGNTSFENCVLACHKCNSRREHAITWLLCEYAGRNGKHYVPLYVREAVAGYYGFHVDISCTVPNSATFR